jgi:hypothetical protein
MPSVIKNRQIVEDHWQAVADDAELPAGPVIVLAGPLEAGAGRVAGTGRAGRGALAEYR